MIRNPLELPEIRHLIGCYLSRSDLATCAQVSRNWMYTFNPILWKEICLTKVNPLNSNVNSKFPELWAINKNVQEVQHLIMYLTHWENLSINFQSLRAIKLACPCLMHARTCPGIIYGAGYYRYVGDLEHSKTVNRTLGMLTTLVSRNVLLRDIEIGCKSLGPHSSRHFWDKLADILDHRRIGDNDATPSLDSLKFTELGIDGQNIRSFWDVCSKSRKICLYSIQFDSHADTFFWEQLGHSIHLNPYPLVYTKLCHITSLEMFKIDTLFISTQLAIVQLCPLLKYLYWLPFSVNTSKEFEKSRLETSSAFLMSLKSKMWPELELLDAVWLRLTDEQWKGFLESVPPGSLKKVFARRSGFGEAAFTTLVNRHSHSVQVLELDGCMNITSLMIVIILRRFVNLEDFGAEVLRACDIEWLGPSIGYQSSSGHGSISSTNWVCMNLRSLRVRYDPSVNSSALGNLNDPYHVQHLQRCHHILFDRISPFRKLETLYIRDATLNSNLLRPRYGIHTINMLPRLNYLIIGKDFHYVGRERILSMLNTTTVLD